MTEAEYQRWRAAQPLAQSSGGFSERKIRSNAVADLMALLTKHAREPETIGRRVLLAAWLLQNEKEVKPETQKSLAEKWGVSEARVSQAISAMGDELEKIRGGEAEK
jgi:hypothetical protein